jgi:hypothetical protein
VLVTFVPGDILYSAGDSPKGIYVIVSGLVKIQYIPSSNTMAVSTNCIRISIQQIVDPSYLTILKMEGKEEIRSHSQLRATGRFLLHNKDL